MPTRSITPYSAALDMAERWPEWLVGPSPLFGQRAAETVSVTTKTIGFCTDLWERDAALCMAHAVVHLDSHPDHLGHLTAEMCAEADWVARLRLDRN